jgi:hypothetical protein
MFGSWRPKIEIDPSYVMIKFGTGRVLVGSFSLSIFVIKLTLQSFPLMSFTISRVGEVFTLKLAYNWMHSQVRETRTLCLIWFGFPSYWRLSKFRDKLLRNEEIKTCHLTWDDLCPRWNGVPNLSPHFGVSSLVLVYIDCLIWTYLLQT